jgi:hypothetical protein
VKPFSTLLIAFLILGGCCAGTQQNAQREMRDDQINDAEGLALAGKRICVDMRHNGVFKTLAESAKCSNPKIIAAYERVHFPYMDLVKHYTDRRLEILEKLDNKTISGLRSDREMDELLAYLKAESHVRDEGL